MNAHFNKEEERNFLNNVVADYKDVAPYSQIKKDIILSLIDQYLAKPESKTGLQLGCANGYETKCLSERMKSLTVVDGSSIFIDRLQSSSSYSNVTFVCSLFEEYTYEAVQQSYDYIFCNYILEHVFNPTEILSNLRPLLAPGGLLFVVVPNFNALSRRIAYKMGLIEDLQALTENDHKHGHRRVCNQDSITRDILNCGFDVVATKGIVFKILADFQLNALLKNKFLTDGHIKALQQLAEDKDNIDFSDSIFITAT